MNISPNRNETYVKPLTKKIKESVESQRKENFLLNESINDNIQKTNEETNSINIKFNNKEIENCGYNSYRNNSCRKLTFNSMNSENNALSDRDILNNNDEETVRNIVEKSITHKNGAAILFKKNKYAEAAQEYQKAIDLLNIDKMYSNIINASNFINNKIECMTNIALCFYQMKKYEDTIAITDEVLKIQNNVRALYFRAKALKNLNRFNEAYDSVKHALTIKSNQSLIRELNDLHEKMKTSNNILEDKSQPTVSFSNKTLPSEDVNTNKIELYKDDNTKKIEIYKEENNKKSNIIIKLLRILITKLYDFIKRHKSVCGIIIVMILFLLKNRVNLNTKDFQRMFSFFK